MSALAQTYVRLYSNVCSPWLKSKRIPKSMMSMELMYLNLGEMKRSLLVISFVCCTLTLAAQDAFPVKYQGAKPDICDFVTAFVDSRHDEVDEDECVDEAFVALARAWDLYQKGLPMVEGETLTVDIRGGYVCLERLSTYESTEDVQKWEMCYWNEIDGKHKLFAYNVLCFRNGQYDPGQYDGLTFYRYDNATKKMRWCEAPGFELRYGADDGTRISYALPRVGKDITASYWYQNGKKKNKALKWNGHKFSF